MNVVIRRRAGLMGLIAVVACCLAVAYLWRFSETGGGTALLLGVLLSVVAVAHGLAWGDARTPLLVADETGLRVRLGGDWTGLTWDRIETIEVDERGRVTDGHVAVLAADPAAALAEANLRSRIGARFNRFVYDAPLVVPFGLTTVVSVVDVSRALTELAGGRTPVVVLDAADQEPTPTVEVTTVSGIQTAAVPAGSEPTGMDAAASVLDEPDLSTGEAESSAQPMPPTVAPADLPAAGPDGASRERPRRLPWSLPKLPLGGRRTGIEAPAASVASPLASHPARREEVTMPVRRDPATDGTLALSEQLADTEPLPEIQQLRRTRDDDPRGEDAPPTGAGNVSLIIDATTDLSARAMSKVRRPAAAPPAGAQDAKVARPGGGQHDEPLLIGHVVREARMQLGLSVDELADRTRIRPFVIESIEVDDFAPCGGDFYARGHLRMLGRVLGIDPEPLVATYDKELAAQPIGARAVFDVELSAGTTGMVRGGTPGSNWGALIATVLVIMLIWGVAQYFTSRPAETLDRSPAHRNSAGLGSPGLGDRPVGRPRRTNVLVLARGGDSRVVVRDRTRKIIFQGLVVDGDSNRVAGPAPLQVMAANGGVVALRAEGKRLGLMGAPGQRSFQRVPARGPR